ncbi:MAG: GtrA family protein [Alphaproteobacteria bacterium]|nr:GtrA family protein [Alphaproteobacteria bacterium]
MNEALNIKATAIQFVRYAMVGLVSNVMGYLIYLLVTYLGMAPKIAMTFLYGVGVTISFFGNRYLVFADGGRLKTTGIKFIAAYLIGYFLNLSLLIVFVDQMGYPHQIVQAIAICVVAVFLFCALKVFVFKKDAP